MSDLWAWPSDGLAVPGLPDANSEAPSRKGGADGAQ